MNPFERDYFYPLIGRSGPMYSDEVFDTLCTEFRIPSESQLEFRDALEGAAEVWAYHVGRGDLSIPAASIKRDLEKVEKLAGRLYDSLNDLDYFCHERFAMKDATLSHDICDGAQRSRYGHKLHRYTDSNGDEVTILLEYQDLIDGVDILRQYASEALAEIPPQRTGRKAVEPMRMWMTNIAATWSDLLGRPFTRDVHDNGEPISEAARFCVTAFAELDPKTPPETVLNAMKKTITAQRRKATGKNSSENEA